MSAYIKDQNKTSSKMIYEVVVKEESPFVLAHRTAPREKPVFSGLSIELLQKVAKLAGFDYRIRLANHHSYGYCNQHGKWEGLISEIHSGAAQIAVGPIPRASNEDGNAIVDFTKPYMNTNINLLVKKPQDDELGQGWMSVPYKTESNTPGEDRGTGLMFQPFKAEVWVMLCLAFIAVSLALFLIGRFSPFEWARQPLKDKDGRYKRKIFELKNSFFFAASTISLQGYKEAPRSTAGRLLACMWFMFVLSTLLAYTASLGSILVARTKAPTRDIAVFPSSYEDLIERKLVKLGGVKNTYVYSTLKGSQMIGDGLLPKLFSYIDDNHEWIMDSKEGIQRVQDWGGKYAIVMETVKSEYISRSRCDLMPYGQSLFRLSYSFAVAKKFPLLERINMAITHLRENGDIQQLLDKHLSSGSCPVRDVSKIVTYSNRPNIQVVSSASLDMKDMAVPFLFLFLGILASGAVLAVEIYYKKRKMSKKEPNEEQEREPLNTANTGSSKIVRAPRSSPPPCPIVKVNNKLQEEKLSNKVDPPIKGNTSIEVVIVNENEKEVDETKVMENESENATEINQNNSEDTVG